MWPSFEQRQGRRNAERTAQASIGIALNRIAAQLTVARCLAMMRLNSIMFLWSR